MNNIDNLFIISPSSIELRPLKLHILNTRLYLYRTIEGLTT